MKRSNNWSVFLHKHLPNPQRSDRVFPIFETLLQLANAFNDARRGQSALVWVRERRCPTREGPRLPSTARAGRYREIAVSRDFEESQPERLDPGPA